MIKTISFLIIVFLTTFIQAQKGEAQLILNDGSIIEGKGEISGISTIVSVKFKNDTLKYKTYSTDEIHGINIKENDYYRLFRYKNTDDSKYPQLMEIISSGKLSLYIKIFGQGIVSRMPLQKRAERYLARYEDAFLKDLFGDFNVDNISFRSNFIYTEINLPRYSYYIGLKDDKAVEFLYTKGLPLSKSFKKAKKEKFSDCPSIIEKVDKKEFKKEDIILLIYYYNDNC